MKRAGEFTSTPSKISPWSVREPVTPDRKRGPPIPLKASPTKQLQIRSAFSRDPIKTYVFFDLECTGLIKNDDSRNLLLRPLEKTEDHYNILNQLCLETRNDELPYITEMSFIAISSETFDELQAERQKYIEWNDRNPVFKKALRKHVPTNTHTRLINPTMMSEGEWESYERLRLSDKNGVIVHSKKDCQRNNSFKEEWPGVIQFFDSLQKPALLIAHNSIKYDLRVIYGELQRNKMLEDYGIPADVFFMDSYCMAKKIEDTIVKELVTVCKYIKFPKVIKNGENEESSEKIVITDSVEELASSTTHNPTTSNNILTSDHPVNILDWDRFSSALKKRIRKNGFVKTLNGEWTYKHGQSTFSLSALYEQLVGGNFTAHYAQQDSEALMHVCISYGNDFIQYANNAASAIPF